jgi:uncharacterized protein (TIGR03083 family)
MEFSRLLACLSEDFAALRACVARDLTASVPTCPQWTAGDLATHVAEVYLHKIEIMRTGKFPTDGWPPPDAREEPTLDLLDRGFRELQADFAARKPADPALTWYEPNQSVGFWIRRMAQETLIHRADAEIAAGDPVGPVPEDLALDGIDEVLDCFLSRVACRSGSQPAFASFGSRHWTEDFAGVLPAEPAPPVLVNTAELGWLIKAGPDGVDLERVRVGPAETLGAAQVSGNPAAVLLWLWRRADDANVSITGDKDAVVLLWQLLYAATQ